MFRFVPRQRPVTGIDIGSDAVTLVSLSRHAGSYRLEAAARAALPAQTIRDARVHDIESLAQTLSSLADGMGPLKRRCVLAMPSSRMVCRQIELPGARDERQIRQHVQEQLGRHLPCPVDEMSLDYHDCPPETEAVHGHRNLVWACRREEIVARVAAAQLAGFRTVIVETQVHALLRAWRSASRVETEPGLALPMAMLELTPRQLGLHVIWRQQLIHYREQPLSAGETASRADPGTLARQANQMLEMFHATAEHGQCEHIVLAGELAQVSGLASLIEEEVGCSTSICNPFDGIETRRREELAIPAGAEASHALACGLAMRGLN